MADDLNGADPTPAGDIPDTLTPEVDASKAQPAVPLSSSLEFTTLAKPMSPPALTFGAGTLLTAAGLDGDRAVIAASATAVPGYELLGELGRGGMGVVYKARQIKAQRIVALKMILAQVHAGAEQRLRFQIEAEAVARLQHPNIVQLHDVGEHNGLPFFSLEFCDGGNLNQQLRQSRPEPQAAANLVETLARAVHYAHLRGVVHRDLKPANVLLTADGLPKVTDFGLAKRTDSDSDVSRSGAVMGTPSYMAPEQAAGKVHDTGPATDVYALGAILYECLTGKPPFKGESAIQTMQFVLNQEAERPSLCNTLVPRDLETICLKCLRKEPGRRYGSAEKLADDLRRFLHGEPIQGRPVSRGERFVKWVRRRPTEAALYGVSLLAVLILIGLGFWFSASLGASRGQVESSRVREEAAGVREAAARELAEEREYFRLVSQVRERLARPQPGWTWANLDDLAQAAHLGPASKHQAELRSDFVNTLNSLDVRLKDTVAKGFGAGCLTFDPTGRYLALGQSRAAGFAVASVQVLDLEGKQEPRHLHIVVKDFAKSLLANRQEGVVVLSFSPDGRWLVAGTNYGQLYRWDLASNSSPQVVEGHKESVLRLVHSKDGTSLFSAGKDNVLKRWSATEWKELASFKTTALIVGLAVHPTEGWLCCSCEDGSMNNLSPDALWPLRIPSLLPGRDVQFAPGGDWMLRSIDNAVSLFSPFNGYPIRSIHAPRSHGQDSAIITDVVFNADASLILDAAADGKRARLWETASERLIAHLPVGAGGTFSPPRIAFHPGGRLFAVTAGDQTLLYEVGGQREQTLEAFQALPIRAFALHPDGRSLAYRTGSILDGGTREVHIRRLGAEASTASSARLFFQVDRQDEYNLLAFAPASSQLLTERNGAILSWHKLQMTTFPGFETKHRIHALCTSPDNHLWVAASEQIQARHLPDGKRVAGWDSTIQRILAGSSLPTAVAAGRKWTVVGGNSGIVTILRAADAQQTATVRETRATIRSVAHSKDEALAVAGSDTGELFLLRVADGKVLQKPAAHRDRVTALAFLGNHWLASGSRDGTLRLWHCDDGQLRELWTQRLDTPVSWLAFHPDGVRLFGLLENERTVRVWHLDRLRARMEKLGLASGLEGLTVQPLPPAVAPDPPAVVPVEAPTGPNGLRMELFADPFLQLPVQVRYDPQINSNWGTKPITPSMPADFVAVRWTGWLKAPRAGRYTLRVKNDGGFRLWLDGKLRLDTVHGGIVTHGIEVDMPGRAQALRIEYLHGRGPAEVQLFWSQISGFPEQIVPSNAFFHDRSAIEPSR